ncbi:glutaredoxin, partial [Skeletonema marinoi]
MPKTAAAAAAAAATNGDADKDVIMSSEETAKTPAAAASNPTESKTPVSSGGMRMRSGKKKKRTAAFTATTPSRKRANKRSAAADEDDKKEGAAAKKRRMTKVNATVDGETVYNDEEMETDDDEGSDSDVEMENNGVATATKVRFETTKEAVAAAQLPESDDGEDDEEEDDDDEEEDDDEDAAAQAEAEARAAAAAAANEQATGWRRLLTQRLRLPSQHTPGPAAAAESPGLPPPAGARRLIFDTGVKSKESNNTSDATTATARNKLLMQTRTKTGGTTKTSQSSKSKATSSSKNKSAVQQPATPASPLQIYSHFLIEELSKNHELKRDMMKCTMGWFVVLLVFFTLGNVTNVMGDYAWDVRQQSMHWSEWYGVTTMDSEGLVAIKESVVDSAAADTTNDDDVEEIITVVDPNLLQQAKAILRAQRMNQHDIQIFENATAEMILAMKMLDSVEDELISSSSSLGSSSVPTLSVSTTDPVVITEYIEAMIDTQDVVVFSKSYCPYCKATKAIFRDMGVQPTVIELDEMENGELVQDIVSEMTEQYTVPNVYVKKQHVGGNDDTQELAESGELQEMLSPPDNNGDDMEQIKSKLDSLNSNIGEKEQLLEYWENALAEVEATIGSLEDGSASQHEVNAALRSLSEASMVPVSAMVVDVADIHVPGERCKGKDYTPLATGKENIEVDVVGGVDVDALDVASDAPLLLEDAQSAYDSLVALAQSTSEALVGPAGPSVHAQQWTQRLVEEECQKEGVDGIPSVQIDLHNDIVKEAATPSPPGAYNARSASKDID